LVYYFISNDDLEKVESCTEGWAAALVAVTLSMEESGGHDGKVSPKNTTTRAEMAQVLYNLLSK
jgi:hypothetical protein